MVKSLSKDMHSSTSLGKMHDIQSPLPSWDTQKRTIWESTSINWSETTIVNISFRPSTSRVQFFASIANPKPPGFKKPLRSCLMSLTMCNIDTFENTQNFFFFFFSTGKHTELYNINGCKSEHIPHDKLWYCMHAYEIQEQFIIFRNLTG